MDNHLYKANSLIKFSDENEYHIEQTVRKAAFILVSASMWTNDTIRIGPVHCPLTFPPDVSLSSTIALNSFELVN